MACFRSLTAGIGPILTSSLSGCDHTRQVLRQLSLATRHLNQKATANLPNNLSAKDFEIKKAVLLQKVTRYDFERVTNPGLSEEALKQHLISKGSDCKALIQRHDEFLYQAEYIQSLLNKFGVDFRTVQKLSYADSDVEWADAIFTAGGDGTFLMAASKVKDHNKPVIGINTDPERSEGYLCLPKCYSSTGRLEQAMGMLLGGDFNWHWRQRIRLTMSDKRPKNEPVDLYKQQLQYPEHRFWEHVRENEICSRSGATQDTSAPPEVLPILALNEVFIGESLSARVSFYEISTDGSTMHKQKSSGLTACTGTGSTSWYFNTNHLSEQSVREIIKISRSKTNGFSSSISDDAIAEITEQFNNSLRFSASDLKMAYTVRDPAAGGIFQVKQPRGFCHEMKVRSRMWDGWVVVDGGMSFRFNDGAVIQLDVRDEDALRCVEIREVTTNGRGN